MSFLMMKKRMMTTNLMMISSLITKMMERLGLEMLMLVWNVLSA